MSSLLSQQTLPQKTADAIIRLIQTNHYTIGSKLPNEYDLSRMLEVSRNTVREAIKLLVSRNILEVRRGAGTFVSNKKGLGEDPLGLTMVSDRIQLTEDILQIRFLLEPRTASLTAQTATQEEIQILSEIAETYQQLCPGDSAYCQNYVSFHAHIALTSRNILIYNIFNSMQNQIMQQQIAIAETCHEQTVKDHLRICQAITRHDGCEAYDAMVLHILHQKEQMERHFTQVSAKG